jgi:hypothetical protein
VGFAPTIPASERATTVHALDRAATATGHVNKLASENVELDPRTYSFIGLDNVIEDTELSRDP